MDCGHVRESVALRPETRAERAELQAHLGTCAECGAVAQRHAALDAMLRSSLLTDPPAPLSQAVASLARAHARALVAGGPARVERERSAVDGRRSGRSRRPRQPRPEDRLAAYVLAALAAIVLGNVVGLSLWRDWLVLAQQLLHAVALVLASPAVWLLPDPAEVLAWLAPALAALSLAWVLRPAVQYGGRRP